MKKNTKKSVQPTIEVETFEVETTPIKELSYTSVIDLKEVIKKQSYVIFDYNLEVLKDTTKPIEDSLFHYHLPDFIILDDSEKKFLFVSYSNDGVDLIKNRFYPVNDKGLKLIMNDQKRGMNYVISDDISNPVSEFDGSDIEFISLIHLMGYDYTKFEFKPDVVLYM